MPSESTIFTVPVISPYSQENMVKETTAVHPESGRRFTERLLNIDISAPEGFKLDRFIAGIDTFALSGNGHC